MAKAPGDQDDVTGASLPDIAVRVDNRVFALVRGASPDPLARRELGVAIGVYCVDAVPLVSPHARRAALLRAVEAPQAEVVRPVRDLETVTPVLVDAVEAGLRDHRHVRRTVLRAAQDCQVRKTVVPVLDVLADGQIDHHLGALGPRDRLVW